MSQADDRAEATVDGRTARRDRNRDAVLDGVLDLFAEGDLDPTAIDVAERSGVSLRSVYRYYDDIDELVRAAIERSMARNDHRFRTPDDAGEGPRVERIERFVEHRCSLYEAITGLATAAATRARTDPRVRAGYQHRLEQLRDQQSVAFAPELDRQRSRSRRDDLEQALWLVSGIEALGYLYGSGAQSPAAARRVMRRPIERLLADDA